MEVEGPSEDFLSNDGYESDVSLPPLAETPEWMVVQSDVEKGSSESAPPWGARPHPHTRSVLSHLLEVELMGGGSAELLWFRLCCLCSSCSSQVHKASEGPDLHAGTTRRRSSPPSKSNRSRSAGGAIRDDIVHAGTFSSEGGAPEESRDAGTGPEVWAPTTSQMDFSSSPDHRGPLSGEGGPSSQDQDQDQAPSSSITCSRPQLECLTSSSSQQHLHEPGVAPGSSAGPGAPPPPQQADLHDPHPPPHLLTPQADANVCQPVSICEEIRLTPQIRGPPLPSPPAPPAPPQVEAPPQGKGPSSAPRCFSRPLSGAAVMEGSPVTLEVEVSGHPEPTLTGWVAYNHLHGNTAA